jgi:phospholipid/cholesterol/gamma-HCH transport system substrate-binding protein
MPATTPVPPRLSIAGRERRTSLRAGAFVLGSILAVAAVLLVLGNAHRLFERHTSYVVYFDDVDGLMVDSPVRLGGLNVGAVQSITFSKDLKDTRVQVQVKVSNEFTSRIRRDSVARVASRGLLGDKTVDLSLGSDAAAVMGEGDELTPGAGNDIGSVLKAGTEVVDNVVGISTELRKAITVYTSPEVTDDLKGSLAALHDILQQVRAGDGALHAVIYDAKTGADVRALVANATRAAQHFDAAISTVDAMLEQVHTGDGAGHALLYGPEGKAALVSLTSAASELGGLIHDVKASRSSAVHALLLGDSKAMVDDLAEAATHLKAVTARIDHGEGSLGALVNDPTAYEDLKTILGNVKRNRLLRELVRLTISNRGEVENTGKVEAGAQPQVKQ